MKRLQEKLNAYPPDYTWPYGDVVDKTATVAGTKLNREMFGDVMQLMEKMMDEAGVTPNDLSDNDDNGWQLYEALNALITSTSKNHTTEDLTLSFPFSTGWSQAGGNWVTLDVDGNVEWNMLLQISAGGTTLVGTLPAAYRPYYTKRFLIADYNGTDGASEFLNLEIAATTGNVLILKQSDGTKPGNRGSLYQTIKYNINQ